MKRIGLVYKWPRTSTPRRRPHRAQKKGGHRAQTQADASTGRALFQDETILRLLPELRRAWSLRGEQARVPITGQNAKCVLWSTLNPRTGHCIVARSATLHQRYFQQFLGLLRRAYPGRANLAPARQRLVAHRPAKPGLGRDRWTSCRFGCQNSVPSSTRWTNSSANSKEASPPIISSKISRHMLISLRAWIRSLSQAESSRKAGCTIQGLLAAENRSNPMPKHDMIFRLFMQR